MRVYLRLDHKNSPTLLPVILLGCNWPITHDNFKDFAIDLKLDSIKNMRVLATTESMNNQFYGNANGQTVAHIFLDYFPK